MKILESMIVGGCLVTSALVGLQSLPDLQSIVVLLVGLAGLALLTKAVTNAVLDELERAKPHAAPQPVAQPENNRLQPYWPVLDALSQPEQPQELVSYPSLQPLAQPVADDSQPLATGDQPARNRWDYIKTVPHCEEVAPKHVPWLGQTELVIDPVDLPDASVPALPLPRRAPTAAEYPMVWDAIMAASSRNAAILAVYGSKDGKTHGWVSKVANFYLRPGSYETPVASSEAVFRHELLGTRDMPGMVAARLGIEVDDDRLASLMAGIDQCEECNAWYDIADECPCQPAQEVA